MKQNRIISFLIIFVTYILASVLGVFIFNKSYSTDFYINILIADVAATVFIYLVGLIFNNASMYDPYWSVAPLIILPLTVLYFGNFHIGIILLLIAVTYWGVRLTINWAYTFKSLLDQDWRYTMLRDKTRKLYQFVNLTGIHLMPTLIVYLAMLPALYYIKNLQFNYFNLIGFVVCIIAATIQLISDYQMHTFRKTNTDKSQTINLGLWKTSRHPNYFGEILMWWGVYFFCLASNLNSWYLLIGAFANTLLFLFISIPLQENRLITYKESYKDYIETTNKLIPWFSSK